MKAGLQIVCALGFGCLPVIADVRYATLLTLFVPILLGLIYFVMWRYDWPPQLVPWLFACVAVGRVGGNWWLNSRRGRLGPVVDSFAWSFVALAVLFFAFEIWRRRRANASTSKALNPLSS
jgi:hypothetical protein